MVSSLNVEHTSLDSLWALATVEYMVLEVDDLIEKESDFLQVSKSLSNTFPHFEHSSGSLGTSAQLILAYYPLSSTPSQ